MPDDRLPPAIDSIPEAVAWWAEHTPEAPALLPGENHAAPVSYRELNERAADLGDRLAQRFLRRPQRQRRVRRNFLGELSHAGLNALVVNDLVDEAGGQRLVRRHQACGKHHFLHARGTEQVGEHGVGPDR